MSSLLLYLYDDDVARAWQPFALTRPIGELLYGAHTFRARAALLFGVPCAGHVSAPHLAGFDEPDAAPVLSEIAATSSQPRLLLSSRAVLDWHTRFDMPSTTAVLLLDDQVVGRFIPAHAAVADTANPLEAQPGDAAVHVRGNVLQRVWDLIAGNPAQLTRDFEAFAGTSDDRTHTGCHTIAYRPGMLRVANGVTIEPNVVLDFTHGPIWLDENVTVRAFTRLAGPAYIGARSTLLGGPYDAVSIGPMCRVHGEVEESIVLGYANKAHDGFLGHAYLGRWVNLGALTTNSDLKNNYGAIRMWTPAGDQDTGLIKLGCLLGDHVKTGIGTMLNTGTVVGAGSNIFGGAMPPKYVPPFSWGSGTDLSTYDSEKFLAVTSVIMKRRNLTLTPAMSAVLRAAWQLEQGQEQQK